jgi:hypothetical protein
MHRQHILSFIKTKIFTTILPELLASEAFEEVTVLIS